MDVFLQTAVQFAYLAWACFYFSQVLLGILAITGWIKPTGIVWFDAIVANSERQVRTQWEYSGKWFARAGLIILLCFAVALSLFIACSVMIDTFGGFGVYFGGRDLDVERMLVRHNGGDEFPELNCFFCR